MSQLINHRAIEDLILKTLHEDMNKTLDIIVDKVVGELKNTVRANVAARMIAYAQSDYNLQYARDELTIRVKMETK